MEFNKMTKEIALKKLYKLHKGAGVFDFDKLEELFLEILRENEILAFNITDALGKLHYLELSSLEDCQRHKQ
jgi:hypothetical protein